MATSIALFMGATAPIILAPTSSLPEKPLPPVSQGNIRGYWFGAEQDGRPGRSSGQPRSPADGKPASEGDEEESIGPHECKTVGDNVQVCRPVPDGKSGSGPSPADLAITEWARLPVPAPRVRTAPPRRNAGLVGLPEWFWAVNWRSLSGRASAGAVWARVNALPQRMTIEPGDGSHPVECAGPGATYDRSKPAVSQRTRCSHTYARSSATQSRGAYRVRVTVVWGGTWTGSDGSGGVLPPRSRSASFQLRIAEAQGLYG